MPDTLSILTHATISSTKTWTSLAEKPTFASPMKPRLFKLTEVYVEGIKPLHDVLQRLEISPKSILIRGKYTGTTTETVERRKGAFIDQALHTVCVEIDNHETPIDTVNDPVKAINAYIESELPEAFHEISYSWSLSSSAGHPTTSGKLKAHVYFYLTNAYTSAQMRAWAKNNKINLDKSVLDEIQIHFCAKPEFAEGLADPVPLRSGFYQGLLGDEVALHLDLVSLGAVAREAIKREAFPCDDPVLDWMFDKSLVKGVSPRGYASIECPFVSEHTTGSGDDTSTCYLPAGTEGYTQGHFACLHDHCRERPDDDFVHKIGYLADKFDVLPEPTPEERAAETAAIVSQFPFVSAEDYSRRPRPEWIIKNILPKAELGVLFGESGAGKSFVALDMAMSIARGIEWNGFKTLQGQVAYVCAEGSGGLRNRLLAYAKNKECGLDMPLKILAAAPNLMDTKTAKALALSVNAMGGAAVTIIDTFAQTTPGANENSGEDVGKAISHCREIARLTGSLVILVHHAGKDLTKGARGWSGLRAAADVEIVVSREGRVRNLKISKQKDGEDGAEWGMELVSENVGMDEDGAIETSCAVRYTAVSRKPAEGTRLGELEQGVIDAFEQDSGAPVALGLAGERVREAFIYKRDGKGPRVDNIDRAIEGVVKKGILRIEAGCLVSGI